MPRKNIVQIQLPPEKPDCCAVCPLCGKIPKEMRKKGSRETHVCLGTMEALGGRFINVKASERDSHHPLKRWCDTRWDAWMSLPGRQIGISYPAYLQCRVPYEQAQQLIIKFHN